MNDSRTPTPGSLSAMMPSLLSEGAREIEVQRSASLRLRERFLSNPRCPKWYRDRADDMAFWLRLQSSQGALI
jgi:hypothetical protein